MRLMVLDKEENWKEHLCLLGEETAELAHEIRQHSIGRKNLEHIAEETLDTIQVAIGVMEKLYKEGVDIQDAIHKHNKKLIDRGWKYKAVVNVSVAKR